MKSAVNKTLFLVALITGSTHLTFGQNRGGSEWKNYRHNVSVGYGFNTLFAGLGEDDKIGVGSMLQRSTFNGSYRYFITNHLSVRGSLTHAFARKNDKNENIDSRVNNLRIDYQSSLSELGAMAEWHFIAESAAGRRGKVRQARGGTAKKMNIGVSVFGGVAVDYLRPYAEYFGQRVVLRPVNSAPGFDTQVSDYEKINFHFPVGGTFRYLLTDMWKVGIEAGYRIGMRDYMDNVSAVYYRDENPHPTSEYDDPSFAGGYVTFEKEKAPVSTLASEKGRKNYFFGFLVLSYTIKTK